MRYEHTLFEQLDVEALAGYAYTATTFLDVGTCVYAWTGECVRERLQPGEIDGRARDQSQWDHNVFGRFNVGWRMVDGHAVHATVAPTATTRTGDERRQTNPDARDPLTAQRDLASVVSGLDYQANLFEDVVENVVFVKNYAQLALSEEPLPGDIFRERQRETLRFGLGDALRVRVWDWLYAKASYEYATRLPRPDEVFGDAVLTLANLELEPETSHNVNLGATVDIRDSELAGIALGGFRADVNTFLREAENLIVLLGNDRVFSYQNVFGARSLGVEGAAGWTSPGELVVLDGNVTYLDFRNSAEGGTFGAYVGDRIPNRPYLFANGAARLQLRAVATDKDELALIWNTRYVHEFFRGWESVGLRQFKQVVPSQLLHAVALSYRVEGDPFTLGFTAEVQNLSDEAAFDFFGVQRPGRAFFFKTTAEF